MTSQESQEQHIKAWQASGLSQVTYCRDHGLNSKTFGNWLRTYRAAQRHSERTSLIPVKIRPTATPSDYLRLRCSSDHTLELPADVSPQWLGELLRCLIVITHAGQIWMVVEPVDMRWGIDGLSLIVQQALGHPPCAGSAFCFAIAPATG